MNRIPVLLHKRPLRSGFFAPGGGGVGESTTVPHLLVSPYRGQPQECEPLSGSCKVLTRRSTSVYTHVALLSQLHLAFSPFLRHLLLVFFLPYLPLSWQAPPPPFSFFSQHEGSDVVPAVLFLLQQVVCCTVGRHHRIRLVSCRTLSLLYATLHVICACSISQIFLTFNSKM